MSSGEPKIQKGQLYKVPPSQEELDMNSVLRVEETPERTEENVLVLQMDNQSIQRIKREIINHLEYILPMKAGENFRIPGNFEIPKFIEKKGVTHGSIVSVCEDPETTNPGGLIEVKVGEGIRFSILVDVLSKFLPIDSRSKFLSRIRKKKNNR